MKKQLLAGAMVFGLCTAPFVAPTESPVQPVAEIGWHIAPSLGWCRLDGLIRGAKVGVIVGGMYGQPTRGLLIGAY